MLATRNVPPEAMPALFRTMADEVDRLVGGIAQPLTNWLREFATETFAQER